MADTHDTSRPYRVADVGFHEGELAVQRRANVEARAAALSRMVGPADLRSAIGGFLAQQSFAAITARDRAGHLWVSPLRGAPGFLAVTSPVTLALQATLPVGDPLRGFPGDQSIGIVVVDFNTRRRVRVNGTAAQSRDGEWVVTVEQAYGNCPNYIRQRSLKDNHPGGTMSADVRANAKLRLNDVQLIERADTLFFGTTNPNRGSDASHRGGPAGFVHVDGGDLWWPDYAGNNMFNSLGNLAVDETAALLFIDFASGQTLQLSGTAVIDWTASRAHAGETGRAVRFTPWRLVAGRRLA